MVFAAASLASCAGATPQMAPVSKGCGDAFSTASIAMNHHYETHPLYGDDYDALYADGEISEDEQPVLDAMMADEETQFMAAIDPVYEACQGVEEFYAGAFSERENADWALLDAPNISHAEMKSMFISSYCYEMEERPACSNFIAADWQ